MALHLLKICVGIDSIAHLAKVQAARRKGGKKAVLHYTRHRPKRVEEILDGGSLYWIVKGFVQVRQAIVGFDWEYFEDEGRYCAIRLDRRLVATVPQARRPHQGWRYLDALDAPPDWRSVGGRKAGLPPALLADLKSLGLI